MPSPSPLTVEVCDITTVPADALINAANSELVGGGGVDGAVHTAAGPDVMRELRALHRDCPTGHAVLTHGGSLPVSWIIHAVGPMWRFGDPTLAGLLDSAYRNALQLAIEKEAHHVTSAALSCGIYHYPWEEAAPIAVRALRSAINPSSPVSRITVCVLDPRLADAFEVALAATS